MAYYRETVGLDDAVPTDSGWKVSGIITVLNSSDSTETATVSDVSGFIGESIDVTVACAVGLPHELAPGDAFTCTYGAALPDGEARTNTAQVTANDMTFYGSTAITFDMPVATRNACIQVLTTTVAPATQWSSAASRSSVRSASTISTNAARRRSSATASISGRS